MIRVILFTVLVILGREGQAQKIKGKSNSITFKGSAIQAEEKRKEGEQNRIAAEYKIAEELKIENEKKAKQLEIEERRKREEERTQLTLQSLGITELPKYYALIMGVSDYAHAGPNLPNLDQPVKDAQQLQIILTQQYTFDPEDVSLLLNPDRKQVIHNLEILSEKLTEKDNLLIFYAGHGFYDKPKDFGYWLAADADVDDRSSWIRNSDLKDYLGAVKSKHTLLIADACFSGSIFKTRNVDAPSELMKFIEVYRYKSRRAMTSGSLTTVPDKSVFIEFLLKKLEENRKPLMTAALLFSRMYEPILNNNNATNRPLFGVIQGVGDEGGDFVFIRKD